MTPQNIIAVKRDGQRHRREEMEALVRGSVDGSFADYQLAAWLMAAYLHPLDAEETSWLTMAMAQSGETLDLSILPKPWVDKHSTGGVGDKTTLVLLPLLSACGLTCVKMSGRGLGITGGTIDKLSSVPGFRLDLSPEEMVRQAGEIGLALTGQTPNLAPADKVLYALRDATATVGSVPLIVSSILSKKIAGGAETIVLDVKCGSGAFMPTLEDARKLAEALAETARLAGRNVRIAITDMSQPLGSAVGNALEVLEAADVLRGEGPPRFRELCVSLAELTLAEAGLPPERAARALESGEALAKAEQWYLAQGAAGLPQAGDLPRAPIVRELSCPAEGWVARFDARLVGQAVVDLGGGRRRKEDAIDPSVGVEVLAVVGSKVTRGQPLLRVHAATQGAAEAALHALESAVEVSESPVQPVPLVLDVV